MIVGNDELLEAFNGNWSRVSNRIKKLFLDYGTHLQKKNYRNQISFYGDTAKYFHYKEVPEESSNYTCLTVILLDFVLKKDENFYRPVFLKEFKSTEK